MTLEEIVSRLEELRTLMSDQTEVCVVKKLKNGDVEFRCIDKIVRREDDDDIIIAIYPE